MNRLIAVCALCMALTSNIVNAQDSSLVLTGIWQEDLPMIASGWANNYQFFEDGHVNFNHNQMDCADSLITASGRYSFKKGVVKITMDSLTYIAGGVLQKSTGSCGSEYELVGGSLTTKKYRHKIKFKVKKMPPLSDYDYLDRIEIEGVNWFRMAHNPEDY